MYVSMYVLAGACNLFLLSCLREGFNSKKNAVFSREENIL